MSTHAADALPDERAAKRLKVDDSTAQVSDAAANEMNTAAPVNGSVKVEAVVDATLPKPEEKAAAQPETGAGQSAVSSNDLAKPTEALELEKSAAQPQAPTEAAKLVPAQDKPAPAKVDARDSGRAPVKAEYVSIRYSW